MRLIHYSDRHLAELNTVTQELPAGDVIGRGHRCDKPAGLWLSVEGDDDWISWCKAEDFGLHRYTHPTEVVLSDDANILHVKGADELEKFTREYGCDAWYYDELPTQAKIDMKMGRVSAISWADVAAKHNGIIIAPYVWEMRLSAAAWYYGWDCASGVIWNKAAVAELRPL